MSTGLKNYVLGPCAPNKKGAPYGELTLRTMSNYASSKGV